MMTACDSDEDDSRDAHSPCSNDAWRTWLAVGATGFGGPAGQVAILHREVVERKRWLSEDEFLAALRVCMLLPGPEAQQLATYAGWRLGGITSGLVAGSLFVLPGALLVTALAWLHAAGRDVPLVASAFAGVRPAVVALVGLAAWRIGRKSIRSSFVGLLAITAAAVMLAGVPFPAVVAACFVVGWLVPSGRAGRSGDQPRQPTARSIPHGVRHGLVVVAISAAIWAACYGVVWYAAAAGGRATSIATLFTETTLFSLGGAYAVVPWALDEAVSRGWLDASERFAALGMGEATPGPLILVVTFIGFIAGWKSTPVSAAVSGIEGACTATLFAFLPSFAMILAVAPAVNSVRATSRVGRALTAVGGAVVATIALLAFRLARDAFFDGGIIGAEAIDPVTISISGLAAAAVAGAKVPSPIVVLAAAVAGMLRGILPTTAS